MKAQIISLINIYIMTLSVLTSKGQTTEYQYLSGTGYDQTVEWEFFCTEGRNAGEWTKIPVPSCWELQDFGTYNYGYDKDTLRGREKGIYKYTFRVPSKWEDKVVNIVFEGSMTDTEVKINGKLAGRVHQGSFYRFKYNISELLLYKEANQLEVIVSKVSSNESVNKAERNADYWIFGGIFRPVYLEMNPKQHIERIALNAQASGSFQADIYLQNLDGANKITAQIYTKDGEKLGAEFTTSVETGDSITHLATNIESPDLWSPEFPHLYKVRFSLQKDDEPVHIVEENFGFRTIELHERDGIYLNGTKIKLKGICRHSFWPASGRTLSPELSLRDAQLIKEMNMNAVRNSHYPPDGHFLDVCDALGILVLDELAGWHNAYDTEVGTQLVTEMLTSNMNHPSIILWINGNEGGHNHALLPLYDNLDIQKRPVIHAWEIFRGTDTQHYINYNYGNGEHFQGHDVFFPTEFLHGLYDGGHGAGLYDYWELMLHSSLSAGGFLWDFSDEGIVRTDRDGEIDTDGNHGADGILGPYREKEGSFYTIKEVWSPIFFEHKEITPDFNGVFCIENRYHFTNTNQCKFSWKLAMMNNPHTTAILEELHETALSPDIAPGKKGLLKLNLPGDWKNFDVLYITVFDPHGKEVYTWSWPIHLPKQMAERIVMKEGLHSPEIVENNTILTVISGTLHISFHTKTGMLYEVKNAKGIIPFNNGPVICEGENDYKSMEYSVEDENVYIHYQFGENSNFHALTWTVYPSGWIKLDIQYYPKDYESNFLGISFSYPEELVEEIRWYGAGPYRVWKNRMRGTTLNVWEKEYNNTITGVNELIYPEFKGYHASMYWAKLLTKEQPVTFVFENEDMFLRLFTPENPPDSYNTAPPFPTGDISFMQGIPPIGTKSQVPENMGPSGKKNMYFDYWKARPKKMTMYFDFSGN